MPKCLTRWWDNYPKFPMQCEKGKQSSITVKQKWNCDRGCEIFLAETSSLPVMFFYKAKF